MEPLCLGSFPIRPQIVVVPLPGASDSPRGEPWEHSGLGVDNRDMWFVKNLKAIKILTRILSASYYKHMLAILNNVKDTTSCPYKICCTEF